ncbi:MAG: B12-binding domain-containing protein [Candidatus Nanopelagicales bacterium]
MTTTPTHDAAAAVVDRYVASVLTGDRVGAGEVVDSCLDQGWQPLDVVCDVLAPAQAHVGRSWEEGRWSVAMEHRASVITAGQLEQLAVLAPAAPDDGDRFGPVPVICCEGEWHTLAAEMAATVMRMRGIPAEMIGPSLPAEEVAGFLGADPPRVVAVSCSLPMHLIGAWRTITALRACGVAVVAGGRGFGPHGRWALTLGADHAASDFRTGADLVQRLRTGPPGLPLGDAVPADVAAEVEVLRREAPTWTELATQAARDQWPGLDARTAAVLATRADIDETVQAIGSAVLVGDEALLREFVAWFEGVIAARELPLSFVSSAFVLLHAAIPASLPRLRAMTRVGLESTTQPII